MQNLINSVGFRGVDENKEFYVNDIPGMSSELLTAVNDLSAIEDFSAKLHAVTSERFRRLIMESVSKCAKWSFVLSKMPKSDTGTALRSYSPSSIACVIDCGSGSKYTAVTMSEVRFVAKTVGSGIVRVYREPLIELVEEIEIEIAQGVNTIPVVFGNWTNDLLNQSIKIELIISDEIELYELQRTSLITDLSVSDTFLDGSGSPAFLMPNVSVVSNIDALINEYYKDLSASYCYLLAANLLEFKLSSYKINLFTNSNRANSEQLAEMYPKEAKAALKGIISTLANELTSNQRVPFENESSYQIGSFNVYENNE